MRSDARGVRPPPSKLLNRFMDKHVLDQTTRSAGHMKKRRHQEDDHQDDELADVTEAGHAAQPKEMMDVTTSQKKTKKTPQSTC